MASRDDHTMATGYVMAFVFVGNDYGHFSRLIVVCVCSLDTFAGHNRREDFVFLHEMWRIKVFRVLRGSKKCNAVAVGSSTVAMPSCVSVVHLIRTSRKRRAIAISVFASFAYLKRRENSSLRRPPWVPVLVWP